MLLFLSMQISAFASDNCTVVKIPVRQIFDSEEYETKRREAVLSVVGAHAFIDYLFDVLEGQKRRLESLQFSWLVSGWMKKDSKR